MKDLDKAEQRKELDQQIQAFLDKGGKVKKLKGKDNPVQRKVTA